MNAPRLVVVLAVLLSAGEALAQQAPAPYSLPWQLRPVRPATVVRVENTLALADDTTTDTTMLTASYKVGQRLAPLVRVAYTVNSPEEGESGSALSNALVAATYAFPLDGGLIVTPFLGVTIPIAQGGGDDGDPDARAANGAGIWARSAMDNALFAVNDMTVIPGIGVAYIKGGLTVQAEATLLQLQRVRGEAVQADESKTNFTTGLHVGYFVTPMISVGGDVRYQRWLNPPAAVDADPTDTLVDTLTFAAGVRAHLKVGTKTWLRPGIAYARGLDDPMSARGFDIIHLDLPVAF